MDIEETADKKSKSIDESLSPKSQKIQPTNQPDISNDFISPKSEQIIAESQEILKFIKKFKKSSNSAIYDSNSKSRNLREKCRFCQLNAYKNNLGELYGPYSSNNHSSIYFHANCILYTKRIDIKNKKIVGLNSELMNSDSKVLLFF